MFKTMQILLDVLEDVIVLKSTLVKARDDEHQYALSPILFFLLSIISFNASADSFYRLPIWSYAGPQGPAVWSRLAPEYKICSRGKNQSPIDLKAVDTRISLDLPDVKFAYKKSSIHLINTGHTIQLPFKNGSKMKIGKKEYELIYFDFHAPAEHIVNGITADLEIHFVHQDKQGDTVIVAVMLNIGKMNYALENIFDNIPKMANTTNILEDKKLNPLDFFPERGGYFSYEGSLTTPPCSEKVTWILLHTSIEASLAQVMKYTSVYRMNARPTQPVNGRKIKRKL